MNSKRLDYFGFRLQPNYQEDAVIVMLTTGVLDSCSGDFKLFIAKSCVAEEETLAFDNNQSFKQTACIINRNRQTLRTIDATGAPIQCSRYFVSQFSQFLSDRGETIFQETLQPISSFEELIEVNEMATTKILQTLQGEVNSWIETKGVRYFNELTNLSNLTEEVGEVARLIGREYGEQSFKEGERPECVKTAIADELADVLFIVTCLANQLDIDLSEAFYRNIDKKNGRDGTRHFENSKLNT